MNHSQVSRRNFFSEKTNEICRLETVRSSLEEFLPDDVSILIASNKKTKEQVRIVNLLKYTNENILPFSEDIPTEVITFLDPTVESLHFDENNNKTLIHLKSRKVMHTKVDF